MTSPKWNNKCEDCSGCPYKKIVSRATTVTRHRKKERKHFRLPN